MCLEFVGLTQQDNWGQHAGCMDVLILCGHSHDLSNWIKQCNWIGLFQSSLCIGGCMCSGYIQGFMQLAKKTSAGPGCCSPLNISPG